MYILFVSGTTLWVIYGLSIMKLPVILANIITGVLSLIILYYKITEKRR